MRDTQRKAVYRWEDFIADKYPHLEYPMTFLECRDMIDKVWLDYRGSEVTPPTLNDGRGTSWARGGRWKISLPVWARKMTVVLHEITHSLLPNDRHNKRFATLYLEMLVKYGKVNSKIARQMGIKQRPRRVHFAPSSACPKPIARIMKTWDNELKILKTELADVKDRIRTHRERKP